jgi:cytochrome c-type biogenesis protein CcmH/NrfG
MKKTTLAILAGTAALAAGLWFLPRGSVQQRAAVADSAKAAKAVATDQETPTDTASVHSMALSAEELAAMQNLRQRLLAADKSQKIAWSDSLARRFIRHGGFDSALVYREKALGWQTTEATLFAAAEAAYMAFSVATSPKTQAGFAAKAQRYYQEVLAKNANRLDAKTHLALTYVSGPTPMQGIKLLRDVVAADPENQEALYQLGILSLQSGQYDKAVGRFVQILAKHPEDTKARFYLGLAYKELGQPAKARQELERVQASDPDPAVQATVRDYLAELKTP